jgi:hypothetical protein
MPTTTPTAPAAAPSSDRCSTSVVWLATNKNSPSAISARSFHSRWPSTEANTHQVSRPHAMLRSGTSHRAGARQWSSAAPNSAARTINSVTLRPAVKGCSENPTLSATAVA